MYSFKQARSLDSYLPYHFYNASAYSRVFYNDLSYYSDGFFTQDHDGSSSGGGGGGGNKNSAASLQRLGTVIL